MNRKLSIEELNRISQTEFKVAHKSGIAIVLDNIRSLSNIGSVFRTSDAFLIDKIFLCGITACPPHREINKTALGATDSIDWKYEDDTLTAISSLKAAGYKIFALEQAENSISLLDIKVKLDEKIALVLGHEVNGVNQLVIDQCDGCIEIPQLGTKHSLNVANSSAIAIWDIWSKKQKAQ
ncbi:MAG: RNA methyltransferase [Salibacteraceae bacterium]